MILLLTRERELRDLPAQITVAETTAREAVAPSRWQFACAIEPSGSRTPSSAKAWPIWPGATAPSSASPSMRAAANGPQPRGIALAARTP